MGLNLQAAADGSILRLAVSLPRRSLGICAVALQHYCSAPAVVRIEKQLGTVSGAAQQGLDRVTAHKLTGSIRLLRTDVVEHQEVAG